MIYNERTIWKHFTKALLWMVGTAFFGLASLLFLKFISLLSEEEISEKELEQVIQNGIVVFISCACVGSALFDLLVSKFKPAGWLATFALFIAPVLLLAFIFLKYLQLYVTYSDLHKFGPGAVTTYVTAAFAVLYCILAKTIYYLHLERQNDALNVS